LKVKEKRRIYTESAEETESAEREKGMRGKLTVPTESGSSIDSGRYKERRRTNTEGTEGTEFTEKKKEKRGK